MGRKGGANRASDTTIGLDNTISVTGAFTGKKQSKGGTINPKSALKLEHLQNLALWASGEASIPSLGAFFGHKLASAQEGLDMPPDPSLITCQRCEIPLQPGFNCTVRIEKNRAKARRRSKKPTNFTFTQNNVVYTCHFCSERNVKRGTSRGQMKGICPPKTKTTANSKPATSKKLVSQKKTTAGDAEVGKWNEVVKSNDITSSTITESNDITSSTVAESNDITSTVAEDIPTDIISSTVAEDIPTVDSPATPLVKTVINLLGSKRKRKNKSGSKKRSEPENSPAQENVENPVSASKKRRRNSWTSLKELAERSEQQRKLNNMSIPFFM